MSGLMGLFGQSTNLDAASFKYNPNKQKRQQQRPPQQQQQQPAQSQYLIQSPVFLYFYDSSKNENTSYGQVTLYVRQVQPNIYQLFAGQQQNSPIINFQMGPTVAWMLRDQVYGYLKDPQGRQWTLRFEDANAASKATETMTSILGPQAQAQPQPQPQPQPQSPSQPAQQQQQPQPQQPQPQQPQPQQPPPQQEAPAQPPQPQQQQPVQPIQPHPQSQHQNLFDNNDDDEDEAVVNTTFVPTIDEEDVLKRLDQLGDLVRSKFDSLVLEAPVTLKPRDLIYEVQSLASQIEDQERQLKEQEQLIDELKQSKQNNRLKTELDIAQTELQSLRSVLKGGKDYRRENDRLKNELKQIKEEELSSLQQNLAELKNQLANAHDISQAAAGTKTKELFFSFMGSALDKLQSIFAGEQNLNVSTVTDQIYEVFHQCSEDIFRQIDERGII